MKKYLILAAFAAIGALVCSCEQEKDINVPEAQSDEVSLVLGGIETRSPEQSAPIVVNKYDLGTLEGGEHFMFEETVVELGALTDNAPETRGTPVYTENVTDVYGNSFNGEIHGESGRVAADGAFETYPLSGGRYAWRRELGFDPWTKAGGPVSFFLHMPATLLPSITIMLRTAAALRSDSSSPPRPPLSSRISSSRSGTSISRPISRNTRTAAPRCCSIMP